MRSKITALLVILSMVLSSWVIVPMDIVRAETDSDTEVVRISTCNFNGIERTLTVTRDGKIYLKMGDTSTRFIYRDINNLGFGEYSVGFDEYGTVWIYDSDNAIRWCNFDFETDDMFFFHVISKPTSEYPSGYVNNVASLVFDDNNEFVVGYTTTDSDKVQPILTYDEIKDFLDIPDDFAPSIPTSAPTATPTPAPAVPSLPEAIPTADPTAVPEPSVNDSESTVSPASARVSIKKQASYTCLYSGGRLISKFALSKKGVLKFKGGKSRKYKGVKKAGFIKKSRNLIFMTKKGAVYTVSPKGKKKTILKKGAKKLIFKEKFVTRVKKKKGSIRVTGK